MTIIDVRRHLEKFIVVVDSAEHAQKIADDNDGEITIDGPGRWAVTVKQEIKVYVTYYT